MASVQFVIVLFRGCIWRIGDSLQDMHSYCTYFDQRFLDRGLAMIRSLRAVDRGCRVVVLCLTASCERALARLHEPGVTAIRLEDFERDDPALRAIKSTRSPRDYAFAFASFLVASLLSALPAGDVLTYLDADLLFYSNPAPMFAAMVGASIGLVGHRHHWWTRRLEKYGRFNVGWVSFRADESGRQAAQWWRASCLEWCYSFVDGDRFADQKYLDHMFEKFPRVVEIAHPGANLGPWNIRRHSIAPGPARSLLVDGEYPLIFFHFSGLREAGPNLYLCSNVSYLVPFSRVVRDLVYKPYIALLGQIRGEIGGLPQEDTPDLRGSPPAHRDRLAPLLRLAGRWMGHYIAV